MQVAQGQGLVKVCALVQAAIGCILLLLVPKMVLTWLLTSTCSGHYLQLGPMHFHYRGSKITIAIIAISILSLSTSFNAYSQYGIRNLLHGSLRIVCERSAVG